MSKFLILLIITSFSLGCYASEELKTIKLECRDDALAFGKELTNASKSHFSKVERDYISFGLALRKRLIQEGAAESQKYLDRDLNIRIFGFINRQILSSEEISYLKYVREELATYPLLISSDLLKKLNDKFINLM
jgi:hypothetical protein